MKLKIYQIDAFTNKVFSGNPAAVCPLDQWLSDRLMQQIAAENNLAETAFYVKKGNYFEIRWFTPTTEVDLCGHATLATAFVLFNHESYTESTIEFYSPRSGTLTVSKNEDFLTLNFPTDTLQEIALTEEFINCFDLIPSIAFKGKTDYLFVFENEEDIVKIRPVFAEIVRLDGRGIIITGKGNEVDFVSRFFAPQVGINEDPVTGSAHSQLIPFWSEKLGKQKMTARQLSKRGGELVCEDNGHRVLMAGQGVLFMKGEIYLP